MVKVSSVFKCIIVCCTIIMLRFTLLFSNDSLISGYGQRFLVATTGIILFIATVIISILHKYMRLYFRWIWIYLCPYIVVLLISIIYTVSTYQYTIQNIISAVTPFLFIFISFPLIYIFSCDNGYEKFLKIIAVLQIIILIFKSVGWYAYNYLHNGLFSNLVLEFKTWMRDGIQRVEPGQLFGLTLVLFIYLAFRNRINFRYICVLFFMMFFLCVVCRFRFQIAVSCATCFIMLYFMKDNKKKKIQWRMLLIAGVLIILASGIIGQLLESATLGGAYGSSTLARIKNVDHYFSIMSERKSYTGLGLLDSTSNSAYSLIYKNEWSDYYLDDIGILGGVVRFGVFSIIIYGWLFFLTLKTCYKCYAYKRQDYLPFLLGISAYMISSCILLNIFDWQRAYAIPFYLAIISYIDGNLTYQRRGIN